MQGVLVYEACGKIAGLKRLESGKIEETFDMHVVILGEQFSGIWSVEGSARPDGTGQIKLSGFIGTKDGHPIKFTGIANGIYKSDGNAVLKGANCFSAPPGKFAKLNSIAVVWEAKVDEAGNVESKGWEWK